ncbi:MAG: alanine racemase [Ruminococcaceae bacterium]|nr:alanine racemase [Oscillospiraceae bacterium]
MMDFCGARTWVEIDLDVFCNNLKLIRQHIGKEVNLLAVIKADGYGHGAVELAKVCEKNDVDVLAVACVDEGIILRKAGILKPILILSYIDDLQIEDMISYDLTPTVFDFEFAKAVNDMALKQNKNVKVHIKLDTGMTRLGFQTYDISETVNEILKINQLSNIIVDGIFTHYADSDNLDLSYCDLQFEKYMSVLDTLKQKGLDIPVKHTCNSAGVMSSSNKYLNMVRCGIMIYGYYPEPHLREKLPGLKPPLSWKAKISQIRELYEDTTVSYARKGKGKKGDKLGVICVGYADGYSRKLSDDFYVLVNGKKANVVGRVCMDQIIVDLTQIPDVKKGDTATLIGTDGNLSITADDFANKLDTISYEILCDIGKRVPRYYFKKDKKVNFDV